MASSNRLDLIIFGATGFTGQHAVKELIGLMKERPSLSWGISGRSKPKLEELLKAQSEQSGVNNIRISALLRLRHFNCACITLVINGFQLFRARFE